MYYKVYNTQAIMNLCLHYKAIVYGMRLRCVYAQIKDIMLRKAHKKLTDMKKKCRQQMINDINLSMKSIAEYYFLRRCLFNFFRDLYIHL